MKKKAINKSNQSFTLMEGLIGAGVLFLGLFAVVSALLAVYIVRSLAL